MHGSIWNPGFRLSQQSAPFPIGVWVQMAMTTVGCKGLNDGNVFVGYCLKPSAGECWFWFAVRWYLPTCSAFQPDTLIVDYGEVVPCSFVERNACNSISGAERESCRNRLAAIGNRSSLLWILRMLWYFVKKCNFQSERTYPRLWQAWFFISVWNIELPA